MKKKMFSAFFAALLVCMALTGCKKNVGTPEDNAVTEETEETEDEEENSGYIFGYSCIDMDNPYFDTLEKSIEAALGQEDYQMIIKNPGSDAELQKQQIQELIEAEVDVVFLSPVDWDAVTPALEALKEADIPVINIDTQVKKTDLVDAFVGSDNKNAGYVCGKDLVVQCPDGGNILILECPTMNSINERITGFEKAILNAGFVVLDRADVNGEKEKAKEKMKEFLEKYPDIDAVMCGNDQIALGASEAVKEVGRTDILIYGVDGSPEVKAEIGKENSPIVATGAQSPIHIGKTAAEVAIVILEGEKYKKETLEETFLINRDNVELYGVDGWQ